MEQEKNTNQVTQQQTQQQQTSVSPTIDVYGSKVNRNDFINYINQNADSFFSTYNDMWSNKQKQQLLQQKDALINNIANGNITRIGNNSMDITNIDNSGIDSTQGGAGQIIVGMADKVAQEVHNQLEAAKPHKTWDNNTLEQSWLNYFYGGKDPGDYSSWVNRDVKNDKGKRATTNRVAAIREWLDTIKPEDYTSGLDAFGGQEGFTNRLNALKQALADGTIDNSDYTTADRLGFGTQLRTLLNDNIVSQEDTNANANDGTSSDEAIKPATDDEIIANAWNGGDPRDIYKQVADTIRNWKKGEYSTRIARASYDSATNYLTNRNKLDKSGVYNVHDTNAQQAYYSTKFFPAFFQNFKKEQFFPEYVNNHNNPISTWKGQQEIWQYIADNLTLAIRNRMYGNGTLLGKYANELNPVLGLDGKPTGFWTIPESFNETTGTEFIYNPDTGEYKRISLSDPKYKYLMQSYLLGKGINLQQTQDQSQDQSQAYKEGGKIDKLQYGGEFIQGAFDNPQITSISSLGVQAAPTAQQIAQQKKLQQQQAQEKAAAAEQKKRIDAGNRVVRDKNGNYHLNESDKIRLGALGQDILGFFTSFAPVYGTAVSGGLGLTSMLTDIAADVKDPQLTKGDVVKNALVNTGLAAVGMLPGGKAGSITSKLVKWAPRLLTIWGASQTFKPAYESIKKVSEGKNLTEQDFKNILWGIKATTSAGTATVTGVRSARYGQLRELRNNVVKPQSKFEISVKKGDTQQKVTLSSEQYHNLNKAKTQTEANSKLKQYLADNNVENADQFSIREGLFPEKVSILRRNKNPLQGKEIKQEATTSTVLGQRAQANENWKAKHPQLSKFMNTNYDIYVNNKTAIPFFAPVLANKLHNLYSPFNNKGFYFKDENPVNTTTQQNRVETSPAGSRNDNTETSPTSAVHPENSIEIPSSASRTNPPTSTPETPTGGTAPTSSENPIVTNSSTSQSNPYPEGYRPPNDYSEIARNIVNSNNQQKFNIKIPQKDLNTKVKESPKQLLDPVRSKIQNLFIPGEDINRNNLAKFINNNIKLFNKLNKKDKEFLKSVSQSNLFGKASAKEREKVLDIVSKMITHIDKKSNKQQAIEATKQALANIRYKQGGILYAKDGVQLPWYSTLQDYDQTKYTTQYGNTLYGINANNQYNSNLVYGNAGNGLGTSRYKPDERYSDFSTTGQNNTRNIENKQYYQEFTNTLKDSFNQYQATKTYKPSKAAMDATKAVLASIKFKKGGILYAEGGATTYDAQVFGKYGKDRKYGGISNTNNNTTWYSNVFNPYQQYILDQLSQYGTNDTYGNWINGMQDSHEKLYQAAGGVNGNFLNEAYNNESDAVRNYQQAYDADQYSKNHLDHGYNTRGIAQAYLAGRYKNIGFDKRNGQDSIDTKWTPDGSYSGQTDDRRILGRKGDFTDQQLADWNNKLKAIGWEQYLDPTTKYYKLRRLQQNPQTQQSSKINGAGPTTIQKSHVLTDILGGLKNHLSDIAEAARVGWNNRFNNRQRDYQLQHMNPILLQPYAFYRKIYGDYGTMSEYNRQGANTQNVANNIASNTADSSLAAATQLQGASQANDLVIKGKLADNQMIRDTYEKALAQNKENLQIANNIANTNRQNLNNNERERAQVVLATNTMNHQNWDKFWQAQDLKAQHSQDERDAMQKYLDYASVMNNNSRMWDPKVREITNRYRQQYLDATTDEQRYAIASKMQDELTSLGYQKQDSLLNALARLRGLKYSYTPVWKAKVTIPTTATPTYAAKGGTLDVTKLVTTAVKEKNKDIERMYKDWSKKDDRFFNQLGKLRQARFDKIIRIK